MHEQMNKTSSDGRRAITYSASQVAGNDPHGDVRTDNREGLALLQRLQFVDKRDASPVQRMLKCGVGSWSSHKKAVDKGADQLALFPQQAPGPKAQAAVNIFSVRPIDDRPDFDVVGESFDKIEKQSWDVSGLPNSAPRTEVIGEAVALNVMLGKKGYKLALPVSPGHGTGVDQVWYKGSDFSSVTEWLIVEAKGPGAGLAVDSNGITQMSKAWVVDRIDKMTRSSDASKAQVAGLIDAALKTGNPPVKGLVITAKDAPDYGASQSQYKSYN